MTQPTLNDPAMEAKFTAAIEACTEQYTATLAAFVTHLAVCEERVNAVIALCGEASAQQHAKVAAALEICEKASSPLLLTMRAAQRGETRASAGTARREYDAAFEPFKKTLGATYFAYTAATESIAVTLANARAIKSGLNQSFLLVESAVKS